MVSMIFAGLCELVSLYIYHSAYMVRK